MIAKSIFKIFIGILAKVIPLKLLIKGNYPPFIPFYHWVGEQLPEHIGSHYSIFKKQFEKDLEWICKHFTPVDLPTILQRPQYKKPAIHLTFDDGLIECKQIILPILKEKNIAATFFVNADFVDNQNIFHRFKLRILQNRNIKTTGLKHYADTEKINQLALQHNVMFNHFLLNRKPYLTREHMHSMLEQGFTIGAHSLDHPEFWLLNEKEQEHQIFESIAKLESQLNIEITTFAFPFTDDQVSKRIFEKLSKSKIKASFGTAGLKEDEFEKHFQRITMETKSNLSAKQVLKTEMLLFKFKKLIGKHKVVHS